MITTEIKNGPSRQIFFESLERHNTGAETQVKFTTKDSLGIVGVIDGVTHEDGSGNSFLFTGWFNHVRLHGYYHTKSRKGWIEVKPST